MKSNLCLTWCRGVLQPRLAHRTEERPQALGQLSFSSSQSAEGISQSALVPGGLWRGWRGGKCCGKLQDGSSFFLLKGKIHDSDLRRSPDVCLGICITRRICEDKDAPRQTLVSPYHSEGMTAIFLVTYFLPEGKTNISEVSFVLRNLELLSKCQQSCKGLILLPRRRQWHPTPVLLPRKSHGWRSLEGCSPWGRWGSDTIERLHFHFSLSCIGEGNGNPLQCSCLENPRDGGAWWAAVSGVAQSPTRQKWLSSNIGAYCFTFIWHLMFFEALTYSFLIRAGFPGVWLPLSLRV